MTSIVGNQVKKFVANYAIFDETNFSSTTFTWTFKNAEFQQDLLQKVDITSAFPIYVKKSHIGEIFISSTYLMRIQKIDVTDVVIIAVPNSKEHNAKQMDTYCDNLFYKLEQAGSWTEYLAPFISTYITKGLTVTLKNVRFRYEEEVPASCWVELVMDQVYIEYTSEESQDIRIDGFGVHIHSDVPREGFWVNAEDWKEKMNTRREPSTAVVSDVGILVTRRPLGDDASASYKISVKPGAPSSGDASDQLNIRVRPMQLHAISSILDTWTFLQVREVYWQHRPPSHIRPRGKHCRDWWQYAYKVVCETKLFPFQFERIKRYRRFYAECVANFKILNSSEDEKKAMEALNSLRQLSRVLNRTTIVLAREEAFMQLESEPVEQQYSSDFDKNAVVGVLKMFTTLPDIRFCLCDESGEQLRAEVSGLHLKYKSSPLEALTSLDISVKDSLVEYNTGGGSLMPGKWLTILSTIESKDCALMEIKVESRQGTMASQNVKMHVRPTRAYLYQPAVSFITNALNKIFGGGHNTAIAHAGIQYTSQLMSAVFPSSSLMSWDLDVCNPQLILPEWGAREKDGALLYFDLGHLKSTFQSPDIKSSADVLGVNRARIENIQVIFAESRSMLESVLKQECEGFFLIPSSIDVRLLNLSSGRQRLVLEMTEMIDLQIDKINDIARVLVNAGFLGRSASSMPDSGPLRTRFQQALELQLRRALRSDSGVSEMRDLARDLRQSRLQRTKSRRKALARGGLYAGLLRQASIRAPSLPDVRPLSESPTMMASGVTALATDRNPLRWEVAVRMSRLRAEVKMGGHVAVTCSEVEMECGKLEYGVAGVFKMQSVECSWWAKGRRIDFLRQEKNTPVTSPICQIVFVDLQPNCPRFQADYGSVRTSVAARIGAVIAHVDQGAVLDILKAAKNFAEQLDEYISEVPQSVDLLSREISRAVNGMIAQNDDMEEEMLRRRSSVIRYHIMTRIAALSVDLSMGSSQTATVFAHVNMEQLELDARVHRQWSRYRCHLRDCFVENRRPGTPYRRILERSTADCDVKLREKKLFKGTVHRNFGSRKQIDSDNASLIMNRVDIVCLPNFVKDVQEFVGLFGQQIAEFSRRMGKRARAELVNMSKSTSRLELKLFMPSPRFLVPIEQDAKQLFTLQLGDLCVDNEDRDIEDHSGLVGDNFKVELKSVKLARAVLRDGRVHSCSDILHSQELADVKLSRDPIGHVLKMTVKTHQVQPTITPRDYHNFLKVSNSWKSLAGAPKRISDRVDYEPKPESEFEEATDVAWTFSCSADVEGIILDINDCKSTSVCVSDEDIVPIGRLEISDLDVTLNIDSSGDYTLESKWEGLSLDDTRETCSNRIDRLISICKEQAHLKYESHGNDNTVNLRLTDMEIYADIFYFRNLVKIFERPEELQLPEDEEVAPSPSTQPVTPGEPWSNGTWHVEVLGANLILHCLSEVAVKEDSDQQFMDVQLTVHQKEDDGSLHPWIFTLKPDETIINVLCFVAIDFGYLNSLFCHVLDSTRIQFIREADPWQEKSEITMQRSDRTEDEPWIGLILSPLLMLHVRRIMETFISPVPEEERGYFSSSSSDSDVADTAMALSKMLVISDTPIMTKLSHLSEMSEEEICINVTLPQRLVTSGPLRSRTSELIEESRVQPPPVDTEQFDIRDTSENAWLIAQDKLPAVKQFPSGPIQLKQTLVLDGDPVRICFHMNVNDPILRLDMDIHEFEVSNWQSEVNIRVRRLQVSVWSFNDEEQQWEALIEKLAKEENGAPFDVNRPDSFRMWSCDVSLSMKETRVLGDQTLPELMQDMEYHGQRLKLDSEAHDYGKLEVDVVEDTSSDEGSIEDLAKALETQTCYFLQVLSTRNEDERPLPLLINYSPSTARRISEITECLTSIQEGRAAHPDKRLIPTLRIINDTGKEMSVWADTEGQIVDPVRCTIDKELQRLEDSLQASTTSNNYKLYLRVKGYNQIRCNVGRHSRISMRPLTPSQEDGIQTATESDFLLVQTETDLALATVRFTSRYFVENKLEMPLLAYIREDLPLVTLSPKTTLALPLGTRELIKLTMESENYELIDCDLSHSVAHEHMQMVSKEESLEPTCNFMKSVVSDDMKMTLTLDAFVKINNFLPYRIWIDFQNSTRAKVEIARGKHAFLPMFAYTDSLSLIITVVNYQDTNWRCDYIMKTSPSKRVKRLRLDEVPSATLARQSFRTGRFICIASRRTDEHDCRVMNLFAPLWIINDKTNIPWQLKERGCPSVVVPTGDEPALFTPRLIASSTQWHHCHVKMCGLTDVVDEGTVLPRWSRRIDVGAVCKTIALTVPKTQKVSHAHCMTDGWMLLLRIEQLPFTYSRLVTILPCYILQNRSHHDICFVEEREGEEVCMNILSDEYKISRGQTIPFWPRGRSLKARVRKATSSRFSKPFAYNEVQSTALKVSDEWALTVEVTGGIDLKPRIIRFRRYRRGDAPIRVENLCANRNVHLQQKGGKAVVLPEFKYTVYLWDNPCGLRHLTCAVIGECEPDCVCQREFEITVSRNCAESIDCVRGRIFWISFIHENQRTLLVTDKENVYRRVQKLSQAEPMKLWMQLRLDEVGVSFISDHREIAFLSVSGTAKSTDLRFPGLFVMYQGAVKNRLLHLRVSQFRLFNSLWRPIYREVLYDKPDESKPFLDFGVKWRIADAKCGQAVDMLRIKFSTIIANIDFGFAMTFYGAFVAPNDPAEESEIEEELNIKRQTLRDIVNTNVGEQEQEYLFRDAVMENFKLRLTLSGDGKIHGAYEPSVRALSILAPLVGSIFSQKDTLLNVSELHRCGLSMPVKNFSSEVYAHVKSNLMRQIHMLVLGIDIIGDPITLYHTVTDGFRDEEVEDLQQHESEKEEEEERKKEEEKKEENEKEEEEEEEGDVEELEVLEGDEETLEEEEEENVPETECKEPHNPRWRRRGRRMFRRGIRRAVVSRRFRVTRVARHVVGGVAHSAAQFTRAMGRLVSKATFDPAFIQERRERFHRAIEPVDCGREAAISLVKGIGAGTFGVIYRPIKGARKSGFGGAVRGLGRGVVGIPTRPIAGALDATSLGAEGLKRLVLHDHFPYPEGRRPRACARKTFSYFSEWEASGQKILFSVDEDKYTLHNGNRYRAHILIGSRRRKAVFVTDTMIMKAKKIFDYKWRSCWTISLPFIREANEDIRSNPKASNVVQKVLIVKHGKNEEDNRTKLIFLPEDKCHRESCSYLKRAIEGAKQDISLRVK